MKWELESYADCVCTVLSFSKVSATRIILKRLLRLNPLPYSLVRAPLSRSTTPFSWPAILLPLWVCDLRFLPL
jgi:hypothetical protein